MPQLWIETYVTQYFWLLLTFLTLYIFNFKHIIPSISLTIKTRNNPLSFKFQDIIEVINTDINILADIKIIKNTLIEDLNECWLNIKPELDIIYWEKSELTIEGQEISYKYWEWEQEIDNKIEEIEEEEEEEEEEIKK